ncbi:MAG TPA: diphosphomevalonate decarboxylase, partial [Anaerolineales bacterium]|nr:diphosphomevalonate decarboxylase [Anaerolineales bacterium]
RNMSTSTATGVACANIAFIKYWGNRNNELRLPVNGSISMNLDGLFTRTAVSFSASKQDQLSINGAEISGKGLERVSYILDIVRAKAGINNRAEVTSENNFPAGAGIASSAAAFAALALAASKATGLNLSEPELSVLARRGSGSASRSIPGGFVEWQIGREEADSYSFSIAPADHWNLADCVAIVNASHKKTGSTEGHAIAGTSPLQNARVADAPRRLEICRNAILQRDFEAFANIIEHDSDMMHSVMMTSNPPLMYWQAATVEIFHQVREWRASGLPVGYTVDAGANVHVLCLGDSAIEVEKRLREIPGVSNVLVAGVGGAAKIV